MRIPLFWLSTTFIVGIILGDEVAWTTAGWFWLVLVALGGYGLLKNAFSLPEKFSQVPFLVLLFLSVFIGAFRYQLAQPHLDTSALAFYNDDGKFYAIEGVIERNPDVRDRYTQLHIRTESFTLEGLDFDQDISGLLLARVPPDLDWHYGDRIILRGRLETPAEDEAFSYRDYLARQGVYSIIPDGEAEFVAGGQGSRVLHSIFSLKEKMLTLVYRFYPDPEASLVAGILLGVESGIPKNVEQAFQDTGTSHIIAISGFNITIVIALFLTLFSRLFGGNWGRGLALVGVIIYTILVGADPAVIRAAVMGGLGLFARQVGRRQAGVNTLVITAAAMLIFDPLVLWDIGFQLSFAAVLGLILYAEPFSDFFVRLVSRRLPEETVDKLVKPVSEYFLLTVAAQITTLPLIVYYFQRFSLISLPANIAILPAQPPVMILGGLGALLGLLSPALGQFISYLVWPFMAYTIRLVEWLAQFQGGVWVLGDVAFWVVLLFYLILFAVTFWPEQVLGRLPALKPGLVFTALFILTMLVWRAGLSAPDGNLHVTLLDVGTGDAVLIETPEGRFVLVGGGPSASQLSDGLGRRLPLGNRQLDFLVVASPLEDEAAALPRVVERFVPGEVLWVGAPNASRDARFLRESLTALSVPITAAQAGQTLDLGQGALLEVLVAGEEGSVLLLTWNRFRMLLPIGVGKEELIGLGRQIGPLSAYLLAGHGAYSANSPAELAALNPNVLLLSVDAGDFRGLPEQELLDALNDYTLLRTDRRGWIEIMTDGVEMWVVSER